MTLLQHCLALWWAGVRWPGFSGLELYQTEGKHYLLLPEGRTSRMAGTTGKREAWEIVRK